MKMRRLPILHRKISGMEVCLGKLVIGIAGSHEGAGVTHFGLMLAAYFGEWVGQKTAYIEYSPKKNIRYLAEYLYGSSEEAKDGPLYFNHGAYYSGVNEQEAAEILGGDYECVLLDLGTDIGRYRTEFLRCDRRIVVSSLAPWKHRELERFIGDGFFAKTGTPWELVVPLAAKREVKLAEREFQKAIYRLPWEPDPFRPSKETLELFRRMF